MSIKTIISLLSAMLLTCLSFADVPDPVIYTLKARVALKSEKYQSIITQSFLWNMNLLTSSNIGSGWIEREGYLIWLPGGKEQMFKIPLEILKGNGKNIEGSEFPRDFKELWIEYKDINSQNTCDIGVVLNLDPNTSVGKVKYDTAIGGNKVPLNIETINIAGLDDKDLNYAQDGHFSNDNVSVIKTKFHKNISAIEKLNLEFVPGTELKSVSLRVAFNNSLKPDVTVKWQELPKDFTMDEDKITVSLWIGRYLRNFFPSEEKVYLEEIIIHLDRHIEQVVKNRPFRRLMFIGSESLLMASHTDEINTGMKIIKVDLEDLSYMYKSDGGTALKQALLYVIPSNVKNYCGIRLNRVMAVSSHEGERPAVLSNIDYFNKEFGGPFMDLNGDNGNVETLKLLNYYSFGKLNKSKIREISNEREPLDNLNSRNEPIIDSHYVKITSKAANSRISSSFSNDNDSVSERKVTAQIEILWSTDVFIEENTYFILRLSDTAKSLTSGVITLKSGNGEQFTRFFEPNKPTNLTGIRGRITEISLMMGLYGGPFTIILEDMAMFSPVSLSLIDALKIPRPTEVTELLYPEIYDKTGIITDTSWGTIQGAVWRKDAAGGFEFNTRVDNQTGIRGIHFDFENSSTVNPESPCWLSVTFIGEHQRVYRDICSETIKGKVYIPIPDIFADGGSDKLGLIKWKLDMGKQIVDTPGHLSFNYQMSIDRLAWLSLSEIMLKTAILSADGENLYPKNIRTDLTSELISGGVWFDIGKMVIDNLTNDIKVLDHPYLKVTSLAADQVLLTGQHFMPEPVIHEKVLWPERLLRTGVFLFILAVLTLGWIERWWLRLWHGTMFIIGYLGIVREKTWAKLLPGNLHKMIFWIVLSGVMYGLNPKGTATNSSYLCVGDLSGIMAFRSLLWLMRPMIIRIWNAADEMIYKESGNVYILGFMVATTGCAVLMVLENDFVAERLAVIGFYCLLAGVAQKVLQMKIKTKAVSGD